MGQFICTHRPKPTDKILDVGGFPEFWKDSGVESHLTIINLQPITPPTDNPKIVTAIADGTKLPYSDRSFDIVFSNSVIEHVHTFDQQRKFALECMRVGKALWIQTPALIFPIEPHYLTPLVHYLPKTWQRRFIRRFTVWAWLTHPNQEMVDRYVDEIRLLTLAELKELFPNCEISRERFLGLIKSYVVVRRA
jgi:hypothetical protein